VGLAVFGIGGAACLAGGWNAKPGRAPEAAPAEIAPAAIVADRFPVAALASTEIAVAATIVGKHELALFDPRPMAPQTAAPAPAPEQPVAVAVAAAAGPVPPAVAHAVHAKPPVHRANNRPGFVLNDAQIASIKQRLNLTPDQERLWPAVAVALRNIAYAKAHDRSARGRGRATQLASIDPESPEVQGLKSAAVPLIMSFSAEQKNEVRSLVHVMGLGKLAAEF
jgi:hypothetical protein